MLKKFLAGLIASAAMIVSAAGSYHFTISRDLTVAGKELKAGDYKVEMKGDTAVLKGGAQAVEVAGHLETEPTKFPTTVVRYGTDRELHEVNFGGTHTKLILGSAGAAAGAVQ